MKCTHHTNKNKQNVHFQINKIIPDATQVMQVLFEQISGGKGFLCQIFTKLFYVYMF